MSLNTLLFVYVAIEERGNGHGEEERLMEDKSGTDFMFRPLEVKQYHRGKERIS